MSRRPRPHHNGLVSFVSSSVSSAKVIFLLRRHFISQSRRLQLLSQQSYRPQVPFLSNTFRQHNHPQQQQQQQTKYQNRFIYRPQLPILIRGKRQLAQLLTLERKKYLKSQIWLGSKLALVGYTITALLLIASTGIYLELAERRHPSPTDWSFLTKVFYRFAKAAEDNNEKSTTPINWVDVWTWNRRVLKKLEDSISDNGKDPSQLFESTTTTSSDDGFRHKYDISFKSEPWRRGYYDVLMSLARSAEHLEGWVKDRTQNIYFPPEYVIRAEDATTVPENTTNDSISLKPLPPKKANPPMADNCDIVAEPPSVIYSKIFATKGFTTTQRIDAALAYAAWLEFKGSYDAAKNTYYRALRIATENLPEGSAKEMIDEATGFLRPNGPVPTANIMRVTASLAAHLATYSKDLDTALNLLLSVLKSRQRSIDVQQISNSTGSHSLRGPHSNVRTQTYASAPLSGDEAFNDIQGSRCDDAAIMLHIGEIIYAAGAQQIDGVKWTQQATYLAEKGWRELEDDGHEKEKCKSCLKVGMESWQLMVANLANLEKMQLSSHSSSNKTQKEASDKRKGFSRLLLNLRRQLLGKIDTGDSRFRSRYWQDEQIKVDDWIARIRSDIFNEEIRSYNRDEWRLLTKYKLF